MVAEKGFVVDVDAELAMQLEDGELESIKDACMAKYPKADGMTVKVVDGYLGYEPHIHPEPIERIRRITGYLVGTLDRFNNGKRAEEHDRVKHGTEMLK